MRDPASINAAVASRPAAKRPLSSDKADTLLLMGACLLVILPHLPHQPLWASIACMSLLAWRAWLTLRGKRLPPRWLLLPMSLAAIAGVYLSYRTFFGRDPGVTMLVLLLALKLLEMHAKRDVFVVVFLGFFLMLTSFFHSQSIGAAALMIAAVTVMLSAQLSFQYTGAAPSIVKRLGISLRMVGLALPLTAILFLLVPRIEGPLWRLPGDAQGGRSGLSNNMTPGNIASLALSDAIAFRVKFEGDAPHKSGLYWRGPVLSRYDGRTWNEGTPASTASPTELRYTGPTLRYQVTLEPQGQPWLFGLEMPLAAPSLPGNAAYITSDWRLVAQQPIHQRLRYELISGTDYILQPEADPDNVANWLQLPAAFNPRTLALAAQIAGRHPSPAQRIDAVLRHFREQAFYYTLQPPLLGQHAMDDFLFSTRAGFCEHYSSAFVVLMRAMGIPSRVVTGYQGGEINNVDGYLVVRQSDAHAWAEVWMEKRGWVRVDPTAAVAPERVTRNLGSALPQPAFGGWLRLEVGDGNWLSGLQRMQRQWRQWHEAIGNGWNQWVLNYTPERQRGFLQSLGFSKPDMRTLILLLLALGLSAVGAMAVVLFRTRERPSPVERLFADLCACMQAQGYPRAPHEGPRAYAERLSSPNSGLPSEKQRAASRFLELYESIRYGAPASGGSGESRPSEAGNQAPATVVSQLRSLLRECK